MLPVARCLFCAPPAENRPAKILAVLALGGSARLSSSPRWRQPFFLSARRASPASLPPHPLRRAFFKNAAIPSFASSRSQISASNSAQASSSAWFAATRLINCLLVADRTRRALQQLGDFAFHRGVQLIRRNGFVQQPERSRFIAVKKMRVQHAPPRVVRADARDDCRRDVGRRESEPRLGQAEARRARADGDVANRNQPGAARIRGP